MRVGIIGAGVLFAAAISAAPVAAGSASNHTKTSATNFSTSQAGYEAQHTMSGTVTKLDTKTGMMGLRTAEGDLMLHFPPSKIADIKKGERVTVELGIKPEASPSASPTTTDHSMKKGGSTK